MAGPNGGAGRVLGSVYPYPRRFGNCTRFPEIRAAEMCLWLVDIYLLPEVNFTIFVSCQIGSNG